jgi:serine/threonine-protein kinase
VVAVKRLLPSHQDDQVLRARLFREAEAIAAINHPNVVHALDAGEDEGGRPYIVLEYVDGRSLEGLVAARGVLRPPDALHIVREICGAVAAVHDAGFAHRDVKPSNVLVLAGAGYDDLTNARVKLIDFGIATAPRFDAARKLTREHTVIGTLEYMPPERVLGESDASAGAGDIYGVGATLFECLTGRVPFEGDAVQIVAQLTTRPPPTVQSLRPEVPYLVEPLLEKALHRDPRVRYPDVRSLERALTAALESLSKAPAGVGASRRLHVRAPYITPVRVEEGSRTLDGRTEDLSANGLMVMLAEKPSDGALLNVRFALPTTGEYVTAKAVVRWTRSHAHGGQARCATGVEFVSLDARVRAAIEKFVAIVGREVERRDPV